MPLSVPRADAKSGASEKRNPEVKGRQDTRLSLERTEFDAKLSQPERPASFRPRGRTEKRASLEKRRQNEAREGDEGIDIGNGGGYIFQNIGYLRGKPVVCILMDRPVYGAQFISKSKVMAAGLHPVVFPPPSWSSTTLDRPRPYSQVPAATTLKFQTNTKMAGSDPDMYCPIFWRSPGNKRSERRDMRRISVAYASISSTMIGYILQEFLILKYNNLNKYIFSKIECLLA